MINAGKSRIDRLRQDPAEKWEIPFTQKEGGSFYQGYSSYPTIPRRAEEIPAGAREALWESCGVDRLGQVFLVPWAVRPTGIRNQRVITPDSVLVIGAKAVGLWTDKPEPGVKAFLKIDDIAAMEDVTILLYGRLSFISSAERLSIRYNTVVREGLDPALFELRKRLSGPAQQVPRDPPDAPELPFKWNLLSLSARTRLAEDSSAAWRFASVPGMRGRAAARGQLLVLNPHELVFMRDPPESPGHFGEDSFIVSRARVTGARIEEDGLVVSAKGAQFPLPMALPLCEQAVRWLA